MTEPQDQPDDRSDDRARRNPAAKALVLLEWMAEAPERDVGVRELAAALGWTPSTLHRILVLLEAEGWLVSDPETARYRLGVRFLHAALIAARRYPLWQTSLPFVEQLVRETAETALLGVYDHERLDVALVASVASPNPVRYVQDEPKARSPLHVGAFGQAVLAFLPPDDRARVLDLRGLPPVTEKTIVDPQVLIEKLELVREQGYVRTQGEQTPGAVGIAAPIIGPRGLVLGSVGLTIPDFRFDVAREPDLAAAVMTCAREINKRLEQDTAQSAETANEESR